MPDLRWSPGAAAVDQVLVEHLGDWYPGDITVGRLCPRCASAGHGRPWARCADLDIPVSISRAGEFLVTAVGLPGAAGIGVDVELLDPGRDWPLDLLLAPGESVDSAAAAAGLWVAKEAILKAQGIGLDRPMSELVVADFDGALWEPAGPPGYVVAVALRR